MSDPTAVQAPRSGKNGSILNQVSDYRSESPDRRSTSSRTVGCDRSSVNATLPTSRQVFRGRSAARSTWGIPRTGIGRRRCCAASSHRFRPRTNGPYGIGDGVRRFTDEPRMGRLERILPVRMNSVISRSGNHHLHGTIPNFPSGHYADGGSEDFGAVSMPALVSDRVTDRVRPVSVTTGPRNDRWWDVLVSQKPHASGGIFASRSAGP